MVSTLVHRGPDADGIWLDSSVAVGLGHRRLKVIELSDDAAQPMVSQSGRYVIAFNGEIYNFKALRQEIGGSHFSWHGDSDTQVLLEAIDLYGLEKAVSKLVGMYAFALWDRSTRQLHLVRDRIGVKPLYYAWVAPGELIFGSELKALRNWPAYNPAICIQAVAAQLRYRYIPAPQSIYRDTFKLEAAHILTVRQQDLVDGCRPAAKRYWNVADAVSSRGQQAEMSEDDYREQLSEILADSVAIRMVSDVPLGAFLSGGIDSSLVVALMQRQSAQPIKTFTIGFEEQAFNEAHHAADVANYLGTDHSELIFTNRDALNLVPKMPYVFDEPFADFSQLPTYLLSQFTRNSVTVALSGDGGDELFYGYDRYVWCERIWRVMGRMPLAMRKLASWLLNRVAPAGWHAGLSARMPEKWLQTSASMQKLSRRLDARSPADLYEKSVSHWGLERLFRDDAPINRSGLSKVFFGDVFQGAPLPQLMPLIDLQTWLPEGVMTKVDRCSMAVGLEAREPLLDHRLAEFAFSMPHALKLENGRGKAILRKVLCQYLPPEMVNRPKMGFSVPIDQWLRGDLREWAADLLSVDRIERQGLFRAETVASVFNAHLNRQGNHGAALWDMLMFQSWYDVWGR